MVTDQKQLETLRKLLYDTFHKYVAGEISKEEAKAVALLGTQFEAVLKAEQLTKLRVKDGN